MADGPGPWQGGTQLISAGALSADALISVDQGGSVVAVTSAGAIAALANLEGGIVNTPISTASGGTLTAAGLVGGLLVRTGPSAAFTDTTDTAAAILAALPAGTAVNDTFLIRIKNATAWPEKLSAGSNVTLPSTTMIPPFSEGNYYGLVTGIGASAAVTLTHLNTAAIATGQNLTNPKSTALSTVGAGTVLAAAIVGGVVTRGGGQSGTPFTDTTDTADLIIAASAPMQGRIGASFIFSYVNATNAVATLTGGSGVTVSGLTAISPNVSVDYLVTYTAASTITMVATGARVAGANNPVLEVTPVQVAATSATVGPAIPLGIPQGGRVMGLTADTVTAFTGATVSAVIGSASGDASYMAALTIKNGGRVVLNPSTAAGAAAFLSVPAGSGLVLTLSQGTPTATGSATITGGYVIG